MMKMQHTFIALTIANLALLLFVVAQQVFGQCAEGVACTARSCSRDCRLGRSGPSEHQHSAAWPVSGRRRNV